MRRIFKWLNKRFGTFNLLPEYFTAVGKRMQDVLWGALLPFVIWGIWFIVSTPPTWVNITAVGVALFLAGYYVWRADHVRLIPRFEVKRFVVNLAPMGAPIAAKALAQLIPTCTTEVRVEKCEGILLRVLRWTNDGWQETMWNEPMPLGWSSGGSGPITLHPGVERRLNIFMIDASGWIHPASVISHHLQAFVPTNNGAVNALRFDVKITSPDCPSVDVTMKAQISNDPYDPFIELAEIRNE